TKILSSDTCLWCLQIQEYVEATTFCGFCKNGMLLTFDEINNTLLPLSDLSLQPLQINIIDYLLGVNVLNILLQLADLIGELMHLTIGRISDSELEFAQMICIFARHIYRVLTFVVPHMDDSHDMKTKLEIMLQSVMKIENVCLENVSSLLIVHVRGLEYIPLFGSDDLGSFLVRVADIEL
ncbi:hypothetical protein HN51_022005, partial [Arachis hypogaea]